MLDQLQENHKDLKAENLQPSIELMSHIPGTTKNIIRDLPAVTSYLLPDLKDQILQLTEKTLNLIKQVINATVTKTFDQRLRLECC